jgi:phage-related minor tail protein
MRRRFAKRAGAIAAVVLAALPASAVFAREGAAPFTVLETGKSYAKLQSAVDAIGGGKGTIAIAPGSIRQCEGLTAGDFAYLA